MIKKKYQKKERDKIKKKQKEKKHAKLIIHKCTRKRDLCSSTGILCSISVVLYRRFGTTYRSYLQGSRKGQALSQLLKMEPIRYSETSVTNYQDKLWKIPEESTHHLHRGESRKHAQNNNVLKSNSHVKPQLYIKERVCTKVTAFLFYFYPEPILTKLLHS